MPNFANTLQTAVIFDVDMEIAATRFDEKDILGVIGQNVRPVIFSGSRAGQSDSSIGVFTGGGFSNERKSFQIFFRDQGAQVTYAGFLVTRRFRPEILNLCCKDLAIHLGAYSIFHKH